MEEKNFTINDIDQRELTGNLFVYLEEETPAGTVVIPTYATHRLDLFKTRMKKERMESKKRDSVIISQKSLENCLEEFRKGKSTELVLPCYCAPLGRKHHTDFLELPVDMEDDVIEAKNLAGVSEAVNWYFDRFKEQFRERNIILGNLHPNEVSAYVRDNYVNPLLEAIKNEDKEKVWALRDRMIVFFYSSEYMQDFFDLFNSSRLKLPAEKSHAALIHDRLFARLDKKHDLVARIDEEIRKL